MKKKDGDIYCKGLEQEDFQRYFATHVGTQQNQRVRSQFKEGYFMNAEGTDKCQVSGLVLCAERKLSIDFDFQGGNRLMIVRRYAEDCLVRNRKGFVCHWNSLFYGHKRKREEFIVDFFKSANQKAS